MNSKVKAHILMIFLVITWGLEYVVAKFGMYELTPTALLFVRISIGTIAVGMVKVFRRDWRLIEKRDIPLLAVGALFGEIIYFESEYNAMTYLPVSLLTILLAFVPALSVIIERVIFKRKANTKIVIGIAICIVGIALVIGADFNILLEGRLLGYIIAFGAVISWNVYNFLTAFLSKKYDPMTIAFTQLLFATIMISPLALREMTPLSEWSNMMWFVALYLGVISAAMGFMISVYALKILGPTPSAVYSDFMPVTSAIGGAVFLGETMTLLQIIGGIIVIASGYIVIKEKGKLDEEREKL